MTNLSQETILNIQHRGNVLATIDYLLRINADGFLALLEEEVPMAFNQHSFRINIFKAGNVRAIVGEKIYIF